MRLGALASSLVPWLAIAASGCGPGPLPQFPPHPPAPSLTLSLPAIEARFREEGTADVKVEVGAPAEALGFGTVDSVVVTLSPAPPALVERAFRYDIEGYLAKYRYVLAIRRFTGWQLDSQRRVVFDEPEPPIESGCRKITVAVDFDMGASPSVAHIVRTCLRRARPPAYASRRLPAIPSQAKGPVLECVLVGGGVSFVYSGLAIDDYGDVYRVNGPREPVGAYVRTIPPDEVEEAMGFAVLASREPAIERPVEPPDGRYVPTLASACSLRLGGNELSLGSPDEPGRRGPATRALLRWLDRRGIVQRP